MDNINCSFGCWHSKWWQDHVIQDSDAERLSILIEIFIEKAAEWSQVIFAINCVDVLRSFAATTKFSCGAMCRPTILPASKSSDSSLGSNGPTLQMRGLWHPFALGDDGQLPVSNDVYLGEDSGDYHPHTLLLTGPNMGGKSTLLRATCLAVILAQVLVLCELICSYQMKSIWICKFGLLRCFVDTFVHFINVLFFCCLQLGCYVPCEICVLSLVDIIFTRLGATDRIMTGESKLTKLYVGPYRFTFGHPCLTLVLGALDGARNTWRNWLLILSEVCYSLQLSICSEYRCVLNWSCHISV